MRPICVIPKHHFGRLLADDDCRVPAVEAYCMQGIRLAYERGLLEPGRA